MRSFKDARDRTWELRVDLQALLRIKSRTGIDYTSLAKLNLLLEHAMSRLEVVEVLLAVVAPQLVERNISEPDFLAGLTGPAWDAGCEATLESVADFFRDTSMPYVSAAIGRAMQMDKAGRAMANDQTANLSTSTS